MAIEARDLSEYRIGRYRTQQILECTDNECIRLAENIAERALKRLPVDNLERQLRLAMTEMFHATEKLNTSY